MGPPPVPVREPVADILSQLPRDDVRVVVGLWWAPTSRQKSWQF
jgi:hypothetical protein